MMQDETKPSGKTMTAPAYFLSFSVENFRCFKQKQTLDLSSSDGEPARWTLILGENGVGKTSLLQMLALMQPTDVDFLGSATKPDIEVLPTLFMGSYITAMFRETAFRLVEGQLTYDERFEVDCSISAGRSFKNSGEKHLFEYHTSFRRNGSGSASHTDYKPELICYGYGASRRMGTTSLSEAPEADTTASLFSDNVELLNAEEWLLRQDYAVSRSKGMVRHRAAVRFERVKSILTTLLPGVDDIRIAEAYSISRTGAQVQAKTPYGWVPIQSLSLGYRTLLTWMVDLASRLFERYPDSKNPLAEPAVVLVDEIDLHLHPRWQRTLIRFLSDTFPNAQFIATAHSPLVVQAAADANIVLLRREGDHVVIENDVEAIKGWRIDQVLTSDLFGLPSARPPQLEAALKERERILGKSRLTKADKAKLAQLEQQIGELPTGETPADIEAVDIIRQAAGLLR